MINFIKNIINKFNKQKILNQELHPQHNPEYSGSWDW